LPKDSKGWHVYGKRGSQKEPLGVLWNRMKKLKKEWHQTGNLLRKNKGICRDAYMYVMNLIFLTLTNAF